MSERTVIGLKPWLPWPLCLMPLWTEPVRAERLAALRIGVAAAVLIDALVFYLPSLDTFLGPGSLGGPDVFDLSAADGGTLSWSILRWVHDPILAHVVFFAWAGSAVLLLLGAATRVSAVAAWALSLSVYNANPWLINSGDNVRNILLFILMFCPSGATWSVDAWLRRSRGREPVCVWPWPLRLLFVQMAVLYFMNGAIKLKSPDWPGGTAMHYVLGNIAWTRLPYEQLPWPDLLGRVFDYVTLIWELGFPLLICIGLTRKPTLWLGALFHLGTGLLFRIGPFPLYMLCFYLPLVPWERYFDRRRIEAGATLAAPPGAL